MAVTTRIPMCYHSNYTKNQGRSNSAHFGAAIVQQVFRTRAENDPDVELVRKTKY